MVTVPNAVNFRRSTALSTFGIFEFIVFSSVFEGFSSFFSLGSDCPSLEAAEFNVSSLLLKSFLFALSFAFAGLSVFLFFALLFASEAASALIYVSLLFPLLSVFD